MSKKSKAKRKDARKLQKAQRKAAKAALYKSYSEKGREAATRRHRKKSEGGGKHQHLMADCGNPGCLRCYPELNNHLLGNGMTRLQWRSALQSIGGKMLPKKQVA
jgi:hypothetical protein